MRMKKRDPIDENNRTLSPAEQRRQDRFDAISTGLTEKGYRMTELVISIVKANVIVLVSAVPLLIIGGGLFFLVNHPVHLELSVMRPFLFLIIYFLLIPVHELIHGITWAAFSENHWKDIEFGVMWQLLTPYCNCKAPLKKGPYLTGGLMPLLVLGIIPSAIGIVAGSLWLLLMGLLMILSAGGDILICLKLVRYQTDAQETLIYDHPTKGGCVVFER